MPEGDQSPFDRIPAADPAVLYTDRVTRQGKTYRGDAACIIVPGAIRDQAVSRVDLVDEILESISLQRV